MLQCRKCPLLFCLAGLTLVVTVLVTSLPSNPSPPTGPARVDAVLTDRLCRENGWYVVPSTEDQPTANPRRFYLCDRPRAWKELVTLNQTGRNLGRWNGVVLVQNLNEEELEAELFVDMPDYIPAYARLVGPVYLFGDPRMAARIETVLRNRSGS